MKDTNLDFDGMAGDGVNRDKNRYAHNQWSGHSNDGRDVNFKRGPTKGNESSSPLMSGHPVNKDPHKKTIATAAQSKNPVESGKARREFPADPDKINVGNTGGRKQTEFWR